jgi:hypothetical protein
MLEQKFHFFLIKIKLNEQYYIVAKCQKGFLSLGGGYSDHKEIWNDVYFSFKNNEYKNFKDRISAKIIETSYLQKSTV